MKLSSFLAIKAIISLVYGIGMVLVPAAFLPLYGITLDPAGTFMARAVGATLIGIGLVCWFARNIADRAGLQGIILALFILDTIGFIVALHAQLSGLMNALGWSDVGIWLLLALGLGYFRFLKPNTS